MARGAHAPSRVVVGAPAGHILAPGQPYTVFGVNKVVMMNHE
jgi:hypothetical protein